MYQMNQPHHMPEVDRYMQFDRICQFRVIQASRQVFREATQIEAIEVVEDPMQELKHSLQDEAALLELDHALETEIPELIEVTRTAEDGSLVYALVPRNSIDHDDPTDPTWLQREEALVSAPKSALSKPLPSVDALPEETRSRIYDRFVQGGGTPEQANKSVQPETVEPNEEPIAEVEIIEPTEAIKPVEQPAKVTVAEKKPRFSRFSKAVAAGVLAVGALVGSMFISGSSEHNPESDKSAVASFTIESTATTKALLSEDFANMVDWANQNPGVDFGDAMSNFYD